MWDGVAAPTSVEARSTDARRPGRSPRSVGSGGGCPSGWSPPPGRCSMPRSSWLTAITGQSLSRDLPEPARKRRHVLDAIAGWMRRPHELQPRRLPAQIAHRRRCIGNVQIIGLPVGDHRRRSRLRPRLRSNIQCRQHPYQRHRDGRRTKVTGLRPKIAIRNSVYAGPAVVTTQRATRPNLRFKPKRLREAPNSAGLTRCVDATLGPTVAACLECSRG